MKQRFWHHCRQLVIVNDALQLRISGTNHHADIRSDTTVGKSSISGTYLARRSRIFLSGVGSHSIR